MRWALAALLLASGPSEWRPPQEADSHEDPAKLRPGYGNEQLHVWWPLTSAETTAIAGIDRARTGDAHALFALAILGSGDKRDDASYARYVTRFDQFVSEHRTSIEGAGDDAKRGDLLNRAMHATFLTGAPNKSDPKIGAYELDQARLTQIFEQGHYNCISSTLLYTALARAFSLPVRGVTTETHAFVDFGPDDPAHADLRFDVETTSATGFGEVHDEKFFRDWAKGWSSSRGLKPLTMEEYNKREIAAMLAPDDADLVHNRLAGYANEANWLFDHKAFRTILLADVGWIAWHDAKALSVVGRGDEAVAIASDVYDRVQPTWPEAGKLKNNLLWVMADRMTELQTKADYEKSFAAIEKHITACHDDAGGLNNLYLTFDGWCVHYPLRSDWAGAPPGRHAVPPHARRPHERAPVIT